MWGALVGCVAGVQAATVARARVIVAAIRAREFVHGFCGAFGHRGMFLLAGESEVGVRVR